MPRVFFNTSSEWPRRPDERCRPARTNRPPPSGEDGYVYPTGTASSVSWRVTHTHTYPNSCELCIYYTAFGSKIGRHRDNFVSQDLATYLRTGDVSVLSRQRNSQLANSNVLILSLGNAPMVLQLSFPGDGVGQRSTYVVHPLFSVPCGCGTLFVFSPTDDLFYCHEAFFEPITLSRFGATGYRLAFVMRWLSPTTAPTHVFYADGVRKGQVKPSETEVSQEQARVKSNRRTRRKKRGLE